MTLVFLAPIQAVYMIKVGCHEMLDTISLRTLLTGGDALLEPYYKGLRDLLPSTIIYQNYGQSEVAGIVTIFKTKDPKERLLLSNKPNSSGTPVPGFSYKV